MTGLGAVTGAGWGVAPLRAALRSGQTAIGALTRIPHAAQRTHVAGQVPLGPPERMRRRARWDHLSNSDAFALFSAIEAVDQAGLGGRELGASAGVFLGSTTGGLFETEQLFEKLVNEPDVRHSRAALASHLCSAPAETVARYLAVGGPVETISSACASGGLAIERALRVLRTKEIDVAVVVGADCLCLTTYSGFNSLRAVDPAPCRPFRADRAGLSLGEGGAAIVLERHDHAAARGAHVLAELLGAGSSCDANHMTAPHPQGSGAAAAMAAALTDARIGSDAVDFVSAHGTGTQLNDSAEWAALQAVFGDRAGAVPVEATKSIVGHLLGAAGVVQAVSAILALMHAEHHPVSGAGPADAALNVRMAFEASTQAALQTALSVNLGFGGANGAVVFGRWGHA